jgi:hypothetical protein
MGLDGFTWVYAVDNMGLYWFIWDYMGLYAVGNMGLYGFIYGFILV